MLAPVWKTPQFYYLNTGAWWQETTMILTRFVFVKRVEGFFIPLFAEVHSLRFHFLEIRVEHYKSYRVNNLGNNHLV